MSSISSSSISIDSDDYDSAGSISSSSEDVEAKPVQRAVRVETKNSVDARAESAKMVRHRGETEDVFNYRKEVYERIRENTDYSPLDCTMYAMMIVKYTTESCIPSQSDLSRIEGIAQKCGIEI